MDYINLDFCVIENPLDKNKRPIIFVTRKGRQYLDETVIEEDDYEKAIYAIRNIGYIESDILTFEFSQDPGFPNIAIDDIKKTLEDKGMEYSDGLEKTIKTEFELFNLKDAKQFLDGIKATQSPSLTPEILFTLKRNTYKIPEIGGKLTLYFYLFIECKFSGDKCYLNLNGDFTSKKNDALRNFIIPFRCDFVRINNIYNPNKIILKSCQTNSDILKKLPMDFNGSFNLKIKDGNQIFDKLFIYYLMEVKNNFPQENRITIEIDSSTNFDKMILMSKEIKKDYDALCYLKYDISTTIDIFEDMIKKALSPKMFAHAENDEFEKAAIIKKDVTYIENKLCELKEILEKKRELNYHQYIKKFHTN